VDTAFNLQKKIKPKNGLLQPTESAGKGKVLQKRRVVPFRKETGHKKDLLILRRKELKENNCGRQSRFGWGYVRRKTAPEERRLMGKKAEERRGRPNKRSSLGSQSSPLSYNTVTKADREKPNTGGIWIHKPPNRGVV